jgi:hypothetical protein
MSPAAVSDEIVERAASEWSMPEPLPLPVPAVSTWRRRWLASKLVLVRVLAGVDSADVLVAIGIVLVARGCYLLAPAAGWLVPGIIVLWYALPQRPRFLSPPPAPSSNLKAEPARLPWRDTDGRS